MMNEIKLVLPVLLGLVVGSCSEQTSAETGPGMTDDSEPHDVRNKEAREDSIKLAMAYEKMDLVGIEIPSLFETEPVQSLAGEDAADDPAFWYNQLTPEASLIFGTNKKGGIYAYDLEGREQAYYPVGMINNIDVRTGVKIGDKELDILGGSNRSDNSIVLFEIFNNGTLSQLAIENGAFDTSDIDEVYGFCLHKATSGQVYPVVNGKNGRIRMVLPEVTPKGNIYLKPHHSWKLDSQPEGMVADDQNRVLYIGEEENGIWKTSLDGSRAPEIIPSSQKINNPYIEYDIEGLAIYQHPSGISDQGFLLASIQGSFSYAVFERTGNNQYITSFKIAKNGNVDGVEETDGLEIYAAPIGEKLPQGLLIVQDGFNYDNNRIINQNFKVVSLEHLLSELSELETL